MKRILTLLLLALSTARAADPAWQAGDRIMFVGDSITDAKMWTAYITAYLHLRYPALDLHVTSYGRGGTDVNDFLYEDDVDANATFHGGAAYQEWPKAVAPMGADWHIIMLGQNNSGTDTQFDTAYRALMTRYATTNPIIVAPWPSTSGTGSTTTGDYETKLADIATDFTAPFCNTWTTLLPMWTDCETFTAATNDTCTATAHGFTVGQKVYVDVATAPGGLPDGNYYIKTVPTADTFTLSSTQGGSTVDITSTGSGTHRISSTWAKLQYPGTQSAATGHQGTTGHALLAYKVITTLGWGTDVSAATINGSAGTLTSDTDCTVTNVALNAYSGVDFDRLDDRLPWAYDRGDSNRTYTDAVSIDSGFAAWQAYTLTVTGLGAGTYDVYMDGVLVASVTHTALAAGWNMSDLTSGPVYEKCQEVLAAIRAQLGVTHPTGDYQPPAGTNLSPNAGMVKYSSNASNEFINNGLRDAALAAALADEIAILDGLDATIHATAQPETVSVSIRLQGAGGGAPGGPRVQPRRKTGGIVDFEWDAIPPGGEPIVGYSLRDSDTGAILFRSAEPHGEPYLHWDTYRAHATADYADGSYRLASAITPLVWVDVERSTDLITWERWGAFVFTEEPRQFFRLVTRRKP